MNVSPKRLAQITAWRAANRYKVLEHKRQYYQRHKAKHAIWKKANPEMVKASRARSAVKNRIRAAEWQKTHPERFREHQRHYNRDASERLTDAYVRKLIARHDGWPLAKLLPEAFIQAKRAHTKLKRLCRSLRT